MSTSGSPIGRNFAAGCPVRGDRSGGMTTAETGRLHHRLTSGQRGFTAATEIGAALDTAVTEPTNRRKYQVFRRFGGLLAELADRRRRGTEVSQRSGKSIGHHFF